MEISEQRIAHQRGAIVIKNLLSKPWLEEIRAPVTDILPATNGDTQENVTKPINENEQKEEENQSLESPQENSQTAENPELDKIKIRFHQVLKEFEGTDPTITHQIPNKNVQGG
jgi:hypothetical protein